jgi:hypothetical protein
MNEATIGIFWYVEGLIKFPNFYILMIHLQAYLLFQLIDLYIY